MNPFPGSKQEEWKGLWTPPQPFPFLLTSGGGAESLWLSEHEMALPCRKYALTDAAFPCMIKKRTNDRMLFKKDLFYDLNRERETEVTGP